MPLFEYECPECRTVDEFLVGPHDMPDIVCIECLTWNKKKVLMDKKASAPSFRIKGYSAANGYSGPKPR